MVEETIIVKLIANARGFLQVMGKSKEEFNNIGRGVRKGNVGFKEMQTKLGRLAFGVRKATLGFRGFKAEFLSVLFFGMALQRFFTGLLKPALQMTGIFDLFSALLAVVFLPIALLLLDILLPWIDRFINLSDATKLMIGKFVLFGAILGSALLIFGIFALGIGGLIAAFGSLFGIIALIIGLALGVKCWNSELPEFFK